MRTTASRAQALLDARGWFRTAGIAGAILGLALAPFAGAQARSKAAPYPAMAPQAAYRIASRADEIALARSAAPASISDKAEILVLGETGYETAAKGSNGFVCIVTRSWASDFGDAEFWNPKHRSPICYNPASARTVLPNYLARTKWVLAGASVAEMEARNKAAWNAGTMRPPEAGAMCYMMSKQGYTSDDAAGPWRPHLMFFVPKAEPEAWGANLPGVPVMGGGGGSEPVSVFFVPVAAWSDGSPDQSPHAGH
jgi:hypothetical protein